MTFCLLFLYLLDSMILFYDKYINNTARWFLLHAVVNFIISFLCIPGMQLFLQDPLSSLVREVDENCIYCGTSRWPLTFAVCLHIYHCIGKFKLKKEDIFHHVVFLPTLAVPGMVLDWGCFGNWLVFFVCGVPGGVDYTILGFQKLEMMKCLNQKRISANMNIWVRLPGIIFAIGIAYVLFVEERYRVPRIPLMIQLIFMPFNVLHYGKQSVINYTLFQVRQFIPSQNWNELKKLDI